MMHTSTVPWRAVNPVWRDSWICALAQSNWNLPLKTNHKRRWSVPAYVYNQKVIILSPPPQGKADAYSSTTLNEKCQRKQQSPPPYAPSNIYCMNPERPFRTRGGEYTMSFSKWEFILHMTTHSVNLLKKIHLH